MRTIPATISTALANPNGVKIRAKVAVYKNRIFLNTLFLSDDYPSGIDTFVPSFAQAPGVNEETPLAQSSCVYTNGIVFTVFAEGGKLKVMKSEDSTVRTLDFISGSGEGFITSDLCRPCFNYGTILYYDAGTHNGLSRLNINFAILASGDANCVTVKTDFGPTDVGPGSAYRTGYEIAYLRIVDGGVGIDLYWRDPFNPSGDTWTRDIFPRRFMWPIEVWENTLDETLAPSKIRKLNFAGIARLQNNSCCIYMTAPDGSVIGVSRNSYGVWSDTFVAVPKDLTRFIIASVGVDINNRVQMCGQFIRTDNYDSGKIYNLCLWSDDGKVFSIDRQTLFSTSGYRFSFLTNGSNVIFTDSNRVMKTGGSWQFCQKSAEKLLIPSSAIKPLSGGSNSEWTLSLTDSDKSFSTHPFMVIGSIAILSIGVQTTNPGSDGLEWIEYDQSIISKTSESRASGMSKFSVTLTPEGIWRTSVMTYPFYLEIQSKSSVRDDMVDMANLTPAEESNSVPEKFCVDFWEGTGPATSGGDFNPTSHGASGNVVYESADLVSHNGLTKYPVIDVFPFTVRVFGWSRIGLPSTNPNTTDNTPATNSNDTFAVTLVVKSSDETDAPERQVILTAPAIAYPPQFWKPDASRPHQDGLIPVVFTVASGGSLALEDRIVRVVVTCSSASPAVQFVERVEIPELIMYSANVLAKAYEVVVDETIPYDYELGDVFGNFSVTAVGAPGVAGGLITGLTVGKYYAVEYLDPEWGYRGQVEKNRGFALNMLQPDGSFWWIANAESNAMNFLKWECIQTDARPYCNNNRVYFKAKATSMGFRASDATDWFNDNWGTCNVRVHNVNPLVDTNTPDAKKTGHISIKQKGLPQIFFSARPYSAFNFSASGRFKASGPGSWSGIVGIAQDAKNYVGARCDSGTVEIIKVRKGIVTVLATASQTRGEDFKIMMSHKDGVINVWIKTSIDWGSPVLSYTWKFSDGPMATDADLFHCGVYTFIDVPMLKICSFYLPDSDGIALLPGSDRSLLASFPSSGRVDVEGVLYDYTSKTADAKEPRGPFELRNSGNWSYNNPNDGENYNGNSIDFTMFEWKSNGTYHEEWKNYLLGSSAGYTLKIKKIDYKAFTITGGATTWLLNRARVFSEKATNGSMSDKIYLGPGLLGITKVAGGEDVFHTHGAYCFQDQSNSIDIYQFTASSGDADAVIADMLATVCKMSGAKPIFPGDKVIEYTTLSSTGVVI